MSTEDGLGPARKITLVLCPDQHRHEEELYVYEMYITFWDGQVLRYMGEPIPRDYWVWVFQPVFAEVIFNHCGPCRILNLLKSS